MSSKPAHVISVRFSDNAWCVVGPQVWLGPYLTRRMALQVAALHAKDFAKAGGSLSLRVHDETGKLVGCWSLPVVSPSDSGFGSAA